MERKRIEQKTESQKPRWKKVTRGTLYPFSDRKNIRVKPNEVISATAEEISKYEDHFELVKEGTGTYGASENETEVKKERKPSVAKANKAKTSTDVYELVPIGQSLYNVLSPGGKVMNEVPLKREAAEGLKTKLETETVGE